MHAAAPFDLELPRVRAAFGDGARAQLRRRLDELAIRRPLLVGTVAAEARHRDVWAAAGDLPAATFFRAEPHCPEAVVEACVATYLGARCDGVVAVGGGSTLGLGKILAAEHGAKFIALPTTYSGSEMTELYGRKVGAEKRTARDPRCRASFVIYDPELTAQLPRSVAVTTGMNSLAHAVEALYGPRTSPLAAPLAEQALRAHRFGLAEIAAGRRTAPALRDALYGGLLGGLLVSSCGIALHHRLCHVLGGLFDLAHGETNSVVLPHAVAYNRVAIGDACTVVERVFERGDAAHALYDFAGEIGAPRSLRALGMPENGIEAAADALLAKNEWNPRPLEREGILELLRAAFAGEAPA